MFVHTAMDRWKRRSLEPPFPIALSFSLPCGLSPIPRREEKAIDDRDKLDKARVERKLN